MPQVLYGTAVPTLANQSYQVGDMLINSAPTSGGVYGWICTVAGYPGTWVTISNSGQGQALTSTLTAGTYANGYKLVLANPAAGASNVLPQAAQHGVGWEVTIKNISANSTTLTPATGENYQDAAAITLGANAVVTLIGNGTTTWYKKA